jgi:hypothetical protein
MRDSLKARKRRVDSVAHKRNASRKVLAMQPATVRGLQIQV